MNICFITSRYPGKHNQSDFAFVKQLVDAIAKQGNHCYVLAPYNFAHYRRLSQRSEEYDVKNGKVTVFRPAYLSLSTFHIGSFNPTKLNYKRALQKAFRMLPVTPDIVYGHFWSSAYAGYEFAKSNNIPLYVATGESTIREICSTTMQLHAFRDYVSGVICVSSKNRDESIRLGLTTDEKCRVFPNAVNAELFHKRDKMMCREQLGMPQEGFIIAFVGWFNERKGSLRVAEAINRIGGVKSIFVGKGDQEPQCDGILFKGVVPHEQVPTYLGAADCFVLPTLAEGCCNAVIEAMACGLPVISSNLPFNWDVLDETNSIMVDPNNVNEISTAIIKLRDDNNLREKLSVGAQKKVASLTIDNRAKAIIDFMEFKTRE